jgi:hypothetical protein
MSGPELCVNPRCRDYDSIHEGMCDLTGAQARPTTADDGPAYRFISYPAGRHGDTIMLPACDTCGAFVGNMSKHTAWHLGER